MTPTSRVPSFWYFCPSTSSLWVGMGGLWWPSTWTPTSTLHAPFPQQPLLCGSGYRSAVAVLHSGTESSLTTDVPLSPLFGGFAASECFLQASMAYDHHVVVCRPLHYTNTVTAGVCPPDSGLLTSVASSVPRSTRQTASDSPVVQMKSITFSATSHHSWLSGAPKHAISKLAVFFVVSFNVFFTLLVILTSSLFTCIAVARTCSAEGRKKSTSICASHLQPCPSSLGQSLSCNHSPAPPTSGHGQGSICALWGGDSHAEPLDLQSQEQRSEKRSLENTQQT